MESAKKLEFIPDLSVKIGPLTLKNPVTTASGCFAYGEEYSDLFDVSTLGAFFTKAVSPEPRLGNPTPRIWETPAGMLNTIGLQNPGVNAFIKDKIPFLNGLGTVWIVNVVGHTVRDYVTVIEKIEEAAGAPGYELNISCPNVEGEGMEFGKDCAVAEALFSACRKATDKPLIGKLTPNVTDITLQAKVAEACGLDGISVINTISGMAINIQTRRSQLAKPTAGLSGPAIRPIAVRMVWECARATKLPIVGQGGIVTAQDALEFIIAGATAISIGTGLWLDPDCCGKVLSGIRGYMAENGFRSISDFRGSIQV
ncbi:MAG: dihydroorotate dehydrogenase [bacterium]|jgi:dihydroorotate dehydrogenase (NAD+) catalytic subunit